MPLLVIFLLAGAFGWVRAARQQANLADKLRYAFIHGLAVALLAFLVATVIDLPLFSG
ncbi:hypothetical protein ACQ5SO_05680 [Rhodovulum sp. DZ06]|uniref:hypothetical protein n=1 Tax=Rhodovulum sp. DZ06 TaxID=3425126 RepID=UPI003D32724C